MTSPRSCRCRYQPKAPKLVLPAARDRRRRKRNPSELASRARLELLSQLLPDWVRRAAQAPAHTHPAQEENRTGKEKCCGLGWINRLWKGPKCESTAKSCPSCRCAHGQSSQPLVAPQAWADLAVLSLSITT
ncbi:hypothetical protein DV515_00012240 [Chloebia gouldiae]|uniref:Uncharacterized protein n=1 Tax=Chloebia gouldiae TaxID=44316 RepID=A0A3L8S5A8_CHLGU|nr:hypothetical protein DV515_00012240 [Chloebia gouldiae]